MSKKDYVFSPKHFSASLEDPASTLYDLKDALSRWTSKEHVVLCSSGSAALYMAMRVVGCKKMALPASTFPAVLEAARLCGIETDIVDCDLETWQSDLSAYSCVSPVHNYGCVHARYPSSAEIVDAAAALLTPNAFYKGAVQCVSFNWNKSISGGGGGAVLCDDDSMADELEGLKRHIGQGAFNFQMPACCAAEAYNQLYCAPERQYHLRNLSLAYDLELERVGLKAYPRGTCRWLTGTMLPTELHVNRAMRDLSNAGFASRATWRPLSEDAPNAWEIHRRGIILPGGYDVDVADVRLVADLLGKVCADRR